MELGWLPVDWEDPDVLQQVAHSCDAFMANNATKSATSSSTSVSRVGTGLLVFLSLCVVGVLARLWQRKPLRNGYESVPGDENI